MADLIDIELAYRQLRALARVTPSSLPDPRDGLFILLLRKTLRLPGGPTDEQIVKFYMHAKSKKWID